MIINTGMRTDIPAFYSEWLSTRLREGYVCVRNPYDQRRVTRYRLDPDVVDIIGFCTKNPAPMLPKMDLLKQYGQYWFVTITPYGRDIEPDVPDKRRVIEDFKTLSGIVGIDSVGWRYDPIFIDSTYTVGRHIADFGEMAASLSGYTRVVVISFIDLYEKVKRGFPEAREVNADDKITLGRELIRIAGNYGMTLKTCAEGDFLAKYGADCRGCMTVETYENALGMRLLAPKKKGARNECACYLSCDIGAYNTCGHLCRYCYANSDAEAVRRNMRLHDPGSPLLIGNILPDDRVHDAEQTSWLDRQITFL